jgi:hypothetical protein
VSSPEQAAVVLGPGQGERIKVGASSLTIKAETPSTAAAVFLSETEIEPGFPGPPPHTHEHMHDLGEAFAGGGAPTSEAIGRIAARYDFRPA